MATAYDAESMDGDVVVPGFVICASDDRHQSGQGTYVQNGDIISSVVGRLHQTQVEQQILVEVRRKDEKNVVPSVGNVVTVRILNVNPRLCKCAILCVQETMLREPFRGIIRKEDVRSTERDSVKMQNSFRPGDIVLARVLSLGENRSYLLSTAENELGVVIALGEAGIRMVPISWTEMQCPKTFVKEYRKVAKVMPESSSQIS